MIHQEEDREYLNQLWANTKDLISDEELAQIEAAGKPVTKLPEIRQELPEAIEASPRPIQFPQGQTPPYKQKMDTSSILMDNANDVLEERIADKNSAQEEYEASKQRQQAYSLDRDAIKERLKKTGVSSYSNPDLDAKMNAAAEDYDSVDLPQSDIYSQLILSLAPALFGAIGGEAAAISAPKAGEKAREIYNANRKQDLESIKFKKEKLLKRYEQLAKLRDAGSKAFNEKREIELKQIQTELQSIEGGEKLAQSDKHQAQNKADSVGKEIANQAIGTSKDVMNNENIPMIEEQKNIRDKNSAARAGARAQQPSEGERKASATRASIIKSNQAFEALATDGVSYPSMKEDLFGVMASMVSGAMPVGEYVNKYVKDPQKRAQIQAESNWIGAKLRNESGAAIGMNEYLREANIYFPRKNDSIDTIQEKAAQRKQVEMNYKYLSGRAPEVPIVPTEVNGSNAQSKQDPEIFKYAKENNISYAQAKAILAGRGYKPNE